MPLGIHFLCYDVFINKSEEKYENNKNVDQSITSINCDAYCVGNCV